VSVEVLNEKLVAGKGTTRRVSKEKTSEFVSKLKNKKIVEIKRRAKNLIFVLHTGEIILVHLKMTGQLVFVPSTSPSPSLGPLQLSFRETSRRGKFFFNRLPRH
jgi:formamidopyrimidine-DNA glycosylase